MTRAQRFTASAIAWDHIKKGVAYDQIPTDYDHAGRDVLAQFDAWWAKRPDIKILSMQGPSRCEELVELVVVYT